MARASNVFARGEPEIKAQAESILNQLGIPMSNAVGMFLRLAKGISDIENGRVYSADEVEEEMHRLYGI